MHAWSFKRAPIKDNAYVHVSVGFGNIYEHEVITWWCVSSRCTNIHIHLLIK